MQKPTGWIAALFIAFIALPANAADLYNNLANSKDGSGFLLPGSGSVWAQSFQTTTNATVTQVTLPLFRTGSATGVIDIYIYDYDTNTNKPLIPGVLLPRFVGQVNIATLPENTPTEYTFNPTPIALLTNTNYYLAVTSNVTSSFGTSANWSYTNNSSGSGLSTYRTSSGDAGFAWASPSNTAPYQMMRIVAVPEPSTYALGLIAAGTLGFVSRRRARKSA